MLLLGGLLYDGRVRREALSLSQHGYDVSVITTPKVRQRPKGLDGVREAQMLLLTRRLFPAIRGLTAKYAEYVCRAAALAAIQRAKVYHAHDLPTLLPAYIAARLNGARLVYDAHELWTEQGGPRSDTGYWHRLERWLLKKADGVLTVNESRAGIMFEEYGAKARPVVVRNCPPRAWVSSARTESLHEFLAQQGAAAPKIALYQGSIAAQRGLDALVESGQHIREDTAIVILGYGDPPEYLASLKSKATDLGLGRKVLFHPPVPNAEIMRYTRSADIGIVFYDDTSRNNRFCAPNKLYEYMMAGLPSVASDLPGIQEIVGKDEVGLTVDSKNPQAIAGAINTLVEHNELYEGMRQRALAAARERFNWECQEEALFSLYRDLVGS